MKIQHLLWSSLVALLAIGSVHAQDVTVIDNPGAVANTVKKTANWGPQEGRSRRRVKDAKAPQAERKAMAAKNGSPVKKAVIASSKTAGTRKQLKANVTQLRKRDSAPRTGVKGSTKSFKARGK